MSCIGDGDDEHAIERGVVDWRHGSSADSLDDVGHGIGVADDQRDSGFAELDDEGIDVFSGYDFWCEMKLGSQRLGCLLCACHLAHVDVLDAGVDQHFRQYLGAAFAGVTEANLGIGSTGTFRMAHENYGLGRGGPKRRAERCQ